MKSFIESKIVNFVNEEIDTYVVSHFAFFADNDKEAQEAYQNMIKAKIIEKNSGNHATASDGTEGIIVGWYSF